MEIKFKTIFVIRNSDHPVQRIIICSSIAEYKRVVICLGEKKPLILYKYCTYI